MNIPPNLFAGSFTPDDRRKIALVCRPQTSLSLLAYAASIAKFHTDIATDFTIGAAAIRMVPMLSDEIDRLQDMADARAAEAIEWREKYLKIEAELSALKSPVLP